MVGGAGAVLDLVAIMMAHYRMSGETWVDAWVRCFQTRNGYITADSVELEFDDEMNQDFLMNIKDYEDMGGTPLDEDLLVIALTEGCAPEFGLKLEMNGERGGLTPRGARLCGRIH